MVARMTIGEFAAATWLSPKALRLYDRKGLLCPDAVEPASGYRKYSPAQVETARLITLLRRIDMPLEQIGEILQLQPQEQAKQIARFREQDAERQARRQSLARFLEHAVGSGSLEGTGQPGVPRFDVASRVVPEAAFLSTTQHTQAKELPKVIQDNAVKLFALAKDRGGASGQLIVIYHGQVGWESDGPIEVCMPIRQCDRAHRIEAKHQELYTKVATEDVQFPRILAAFEAVQLRASQLGLNPIAPPREVYESVGDDTIPSCEVALPVAGMPR